MIRIWDHIFTLSSGKLITFSFPLVILLVHRRAQVNVLTITYLLIFYWWGQNARLKFCSQTFIVPNLLYTPRISDMLLSLSKQQNKTQRRKKCTNHCWQHTYLDFVVLHRSTKQERHPSLSQSELPSEATTNAAAPRPRTCFLDQRWCRWKSACTPCTALRCRALLRWPSFGIVLSVKKRFSMNA
jgi:hypothetical protein